MAITSLNISSSITHLCPCSATITQSSLFVRPISRSYSYQQYRNGSALVRGRQQRAWSLGTDFVDSLWCRKLTHNTGLDIESSKRLHRKRVGVARAGLPVVSSIPVLGPVFNAVFNPVVLMIIYLAGASRFWSGFSRTAYTNSAPTKLALTALWPALYVASKAYRANFKKAVL